MEVSILDQLYVFCMSLIIGVALGALYDIVRMWRAFLGIRYVNKFTEKLKLLRLPLIKNPLLKEKKQNDRAQGILLFITDIIYFLIVTLIMIIFVYSVSGGVVRWFIFVGAMMGLLIYYFTIGKIVISVSEYIVFFVRIVWAYVVYFVTYPFLPIINKIKRIFRRLKTKITEKIKRHQKPKTPYKTRKNIYEIGKNTE